MKNCWDDSLQSLVGGVYMYIRGAGVCVAHSLTQVGRRLHIQPTPAVGTFHV